uniref:DUF6534 domain-containing protein n=1 Tax=Mycena chlorophos TaxID=658473 RepID=A0ABQ0LGW4_MYCCL|nr:predicted protein [Mycena chlorophos]
MATSSAPDPLDSVQFLNDTIGALEIGVLFSYLLLGITTAQVYIYYTHLPSREDPPWLRMMVAGVWLVETTHASLSGYVLWYWTVFDYGDRLGVFGSIQTPLLGSFILTGLITTVVQLFFIYRIYLLSQSIYVPIVLAILSFVYLLGILAFTGVGFGHRTFVSAEAILGWDVEAAAILSVCLDISIAATLVFLLLRTRGQGDRRTSNMVDKLVAWSIETGAMTSLCSVFILAFYEAKPDSCSLHFPSVRTHSHEHAVIWLAVFIVKSRLFSNSFLASLNSRTALRMMNQNVIPSGGGRGGVSIPVFNSDTSRQETTNDVELFRVAGIDARSGSRQDSDEGLSSDARHFDRGAYSDTYDYESKRRPNFMDKGAISYPGP